MTATLDVHDTKAIPLTRLVKVELRKMGDTRAGMWLLIAAGTVSALVIVALFIWGKVGDRNFLGFAQAAGIPLSFIMPILGILLVTQEWGQRTALVTFAQVPARGKVLVAKVVAALLFALAALVIALAVAAVFAELGDSPDPFQDVTWGLMVRIVLGFLIGLFWGLAFGSLMLSSAFAIVSYFVVPIVLSIITGIWESARRNLLWFDLNTSSSKLFDIHGLSGKEWAQIGTGLLIWVVVPGAVGVWRVLKSEVK